MDRFTTNDLLTLTHAGEQDGDEKIRRVSVYAPMHRSGRKVQQNAIRFKNLLKQARADLAEHGLANSDIDQLLEPAESLLNDDDFWQHQAEGLAVFIEPTGVTTLRLPHEFPEIVRVARSFHVRPLTQLLTDDDQWHILAVSPNQVRLLQASLRHVEELHPQSLPDNLRSALQIDEYVSTLQFHSVGRGSGGEAIHHGQGGGDPDVKKQDELLQYFHRLDAALRESLPAPRLPLLFAGVEYLFPIFRSACHYSGLVDQPITGNPDALSPKELHERSCELMRSRMQERRRVAIETYSEKAHTEWAGDDPETLLLAARLGQVDSLALVPDAKWWFVEGDDGHLTVREAPFEDSRDLVNVAAVETLRHGGDVVTLTEQPDGEFPESGMAAIFRSPAESFVSTP